MANMSYCRFENTLREMRDCYDALQNITPENIEWMSTYERNSAVELIELCKEVNYLVSEYPELISKLSE